MGGSHSSVFRHRRENCHLHPQPIEFPVFEEKDRPPKITAIATASNHALALGDSGELYAWGHNDMGQCGLGYLGAPPNQPVARRPDGSALPAVDAVGAATRVQSLGLIRLDCIAAGWGHSIVSGTRANRSAVTYVFGRVHRASLPAPEGDGAQRGKGGSRKRGKGGRGSASAEPAAPTDDQGVAEPTLLSDLNGVHLDALAAGSAHVLAGGSADAGAGVYSWGSGYGGRLGHGEVGDDAGGDGNGERGDNALTPHAKHDVHAPVAIVCFEGDRRGSDDEDQEEDEAAKAEAEAKAKAKAKAKLMRGGGAKAAKAAARKRAAQAKAAEPKPPTHMICLAAGASSSFGVSADKTLWAWGCGEHGQLGMHSEADMQKADKGRPPPCVWVPTKVKALLSQKVQSVAAGWGHTLVLTEAGYVYAFGCNVNGQLGHGDEKRRVLPTRVGSKEDAFGQERIAAVACGADHSVAVTTGGDVYSWGLGDSGQLGHGLDQDELAPKLVLAISPTHGGAGADEHVVAAAAGFRHTLLLTRGGTVLGCGWRGYGQLGDGVPSPAPRDEEKDADGEGGDPVRRAKAKGSVSPSKAKKKRSKRK